MSDDLQRRPNPSGWTPPKAPYNPYDPADARPPEGYPSEFKVPGAAPLGISSIPRDPTQYKKVNETMKRLNYTPRPKLAKYPGQYMVLRKVDTNQRLNTGTRMFGALISVSIIGYFTFFYRWQDGSETVMSEFYRQRLQWQERFFGLTDQEYQDLYHPKGAQTTLKSVRDVDFVHQDATKENQFVLARPSERHVLEAQRLQQEEEERTLRALDEHREFAKQFMEPEQKKKRFWFF
ncbi:hypothetical protein PUMCH_004641 [Australozyma saopauloensis]|uniref:Uncharacterized protein n=1 Tax=Australozyma saopauloensis TaxID=291208 RepID=A0AAX4HF67_9ASCO|nr:hypothetical protein PUMCH_004641 [[Candida] saopauloensis]